MHLHLSGVGDIRETVAFKIVLCGAFGRTAATFAYKPQRRSPEGIVYTLDASLIPILLYTILLKGTQVEFKDPNECDTFLKSS